MEKGYIYLLQEANFINTKQSIYKIGKTKQDLLKRYNNYPKGSDLLLHKMCHDCDVLEKELISDFKREFIHRTDIGNEYFEGFVLDMIDHIDNKLKIANRDHYSKSKQNKEKPSIFNFGEEKVDHITDDIFIELLSRNNNIVPSRIYFSSPIVRYIKFKYFDKNHPENATFKIINKQYYIRDEGNWLCINNGLILRKLYHNNISEMSHRYWKIENNDKLDIGEITKKMCNYSIYKDITSDIHDLIVNLEYINT